ncbi:MAG: FAD-dependent oxidoreductase, partial [Anaerolineales bacterium]|nr:FAD-dependent oxidoreductase [Anaerolineales bacterium]
MASYPQLLSPLRVGPFVLRNRITQAGFNTNLASGEGDATQRLCDYLAAKAKGGVSLVVVEATAVRFPEGAGPITELRADEDRFVAGLSELARSININRSLSCLQLHHAGRFANIPVPISPSTRRCRSLTTGKMVKPRALEEQEVREIVQAYGDAAYRAQKAGFDMVEIHAASGYLPAAFISPLINNRTDKYGGSLENRMRFTLDIVRDIQRKCGRLYPIGIRFMAREGLPGGLEIEESKIFAQKLEEMGLIYLSVVSGTYETYGMGKGVLAIRSPESLWVEDGAAIKEVIDIPVITNGNIFEPRVMEEIIASGKADAIALGRPLLADPAMAVKLASGREEEIDKCLRCGYCCHVNILGRPPACSVNPFIGREREWDEMRPADSPKTVVVIGGGPGGMTAAWIAAHRGHRVTLYEQERVLGGTLRVASNPAGKRRFWDYMGRSLTRKVDVAGVNIVADTRVTPEMLEVLIESGVEVVILATGAEPCRPDVPGVDRDNVILAEEYLNGVKTAGERVVIVGGGQVGAETAETIAERGEAVELTIVEQLPGIMSESDVLNKLYMVNRLGELGVKL